MRDIAVIGGGAAGMTAAYFASSAGASVTLFERNEKLGKKMYITGKGRCNLTNDCDTEDFFSNVPTNPKFLLSAVYGFSPRDTARFFEETARVPLKTERGGRVFPVSDKSSDVIKGLSGLLLKQHADIRLNSRVTGIKTENGAVKGVYFDGGFFAADAVIIATGGLSYPSTGSTGDGYAFAKAAGHTLKKTSPSLVGLVTDEAETFKEAQGLTLKNVSLTLKKGKKAVYSEQGELLITHFGVSGPLVLSASAHINGEAADYTLEIDLKPALDEKKLDARVLRDFDENRNKQLKNALFGLMPKSMTVPFISAAGLDGEKSVNSVTRDERAALVATLKCLKMHVISLRSIEEAIVTRGGVSVREIDPSTMESKKVSGLYFAGEVMDVDAYTGGFNLQIAFSTGRLAGLSAAKEPNE